jgi:hypothetical protein
MEGLYIETSSYGATAAFWKALGYENTFATDHGSGHWVHPAGGPYLFIAERHGVELEMHPIMRIADAAAFSGRFEGELATPFEPTHWSMLEASLHDPDGRRVSLQAPLPDGASAPSIDAHHAEKYGSH